jgi:hypothetical protein
LSFASAQDGSVINLAKLLIPLAVRPFFYRFRT